MEHSKHSTWGSQRDVPKGVKERRAERDGEKKKNREETAFPAAPAPSHCFQRCLVALGGSANQTGRQHFLCCPKSLMKACKKKKKKLKKPNCPQMESFLHERDGGMFGSSHGPRSSFLGLFRQFLLQLVPPRGDLSSAQFLLVFFPKMR